MTRQRGRHRAPSRHTGRRTIAAAIAAAPIVIAAPPASADIPAAVPTAVSDAVLEIIAQCESGNRNVNNSTFPKSSASGFLQIIDGTWRRFGGLEFAPRAIHATRGEQFIVGRRIAAANPSLSDWNPSKNCWGSKVARHASGAEAPRATPPATPTTPRHSITVVRGDTLSGIAVRARVTVAELYARNRAVVGADPNLIFPGQVLAVD